MRREEMNCLTYRLSFFLVHGHRDVHQDWAGIGCQQGILTTFSLTQIISPAVPVGTIGREHREAGVFVGLIRFVVAVAKREVLAHLRAMEMLLTSFLGLKGDGNIRFCLSWRIHITECLAVVDRATISAEYSHAGVFMHLIGFVVAAAECRSKGYVLTFEFCLVTWVFLEDLVLQWWRWRSGWRSGLREAAQFAALVAATTTGLSGCHTYNGQGKGGHHDHTAEGERIHFW